MKITRNQREERARKLIPYLRRGRSIPEGMRLAKIDNVSENTSVWISAIAYMLSDDMTTGGYPKK